MKKVNEEKKTYKYSADKISEINNFIKNNHFNSAYKSTIEYNEKYPDDVVGLLYLFELSMRFNKIDELDELYEKLNNRINELPERNMLDYKTDVLRYLYLKKEYEKAYSHMQDCYYDFIHNDVGFNTILLFLEKELHIKHGYSTFKEFSYVEDLLCNYSDEKSLKHVSDRHRYSIDNLSCFSENIDINKLFKLVKKHLPDKNSYYTFFNQSLTNFKLDNCGYGLINTQDTTNYATNYFQVASFYDTDHIITMYPYLKNNEELYIDITNEMFLDDIVVTKSNSIDKFNKKFGNFVAKK